MQQAFKIRYPLNLHELDDDISSHLRLKFHHLLRALLKVEIFRRDRKFISDCTISIVKDLPKYDKHSRKFAKLNTREHK